MRSLTAICFLVGCLLVTPILAAICPNGCVCSTTRDGLHRAACSSLTNLYKFTLRQKHHNINILDLSHNNITKLTHELNRLTEIVTLDLSTNGITELNKFLYNAKKLVHLNLANNRIEKLSLTQLPKSVSSLDVTNNLLRDVPSDIDHLTSLEHLELEGNPLNCSCRNLLIRDRLLLGNVFIDNAKCAFPVKNKGQSWLELKTKETCKVPKIETNNLDMMMGDQPIDAVQITEDASALKFAPLVANNDLEDGSVIRGENIMDDDDSLQFMKVGSTSSPFLNIMEGSGEGESTTLTDIVEPQNERKYQASLFANDEVLPTDDTYSKEQIEEGSGEGSGFGFIDFEEPSIVETTTPAYIEELNPGSVSRLFDDDINNGTTEFPIPKPPTIYEGGPFWHLQTEAPTTTTVTTTITTTTSTTVVPMIIRDTTISEQMRVTQASAILEQEATSRPPPHKTGTYVCIAIIVVILVSLIGFAIFKGQMRKRRDKRLLRQQKKDVEKASKEMVDMNKSLLGKPAAVDTSSERKTNGKYELVPTHETHFKKNKNGDVANGIEHDDNKEIRTDSPRDSNQNKSSSKDNNLTNGNMVSPKINSFDAEPSSSPQSGKDNQSLSSEDIFVPINDNDTGRLNGTLDSDLSQPLLNGDPITDSDLLSPSYVPVYPPDMGRVRIKLTETPKPKTPVLVTRSRSNAGDIIITPSIDGDVRKATT